MTEIQSVMISVIGHELFETEIKSEKITEFNNEQFRELYSISKHHDMAHIVGNYLIRNNIVPEGEIKDKFKKSTFTAIQRYSRLESELVSIKKVFSENEIKFLPLKGAVIRKMYNTPWMRMSCDIDILIHEEDIEKASNVLCSTLSYTEEHKTYHDVAFKSASGTKLELHYNIKENLPKVDPLLEKSWDYSVRLENSEFEYEFTPEYFIFYFIAHASKHFRSGGCGIKPVIDLHILEDVLEYDKEKLFGLLKSAGLELFYSNMLNLSKCWFMAENINETLELMEKYILDGGIYGTIENHVNYECTEKDSSVKYLFRRLWMPYDVLIQRYPALRGKRILQPFFEIYRMMDIVRSQKRKRLRNELRYTKNYSQEKSDKLKILMNSLGI